MHEAFKKTEEDISHSLSINSIQGEGKLFFNEVLMKKIIEEQKTDKEKIEEMKMTMQKKKQYSSIMRRLRGRVIQEGFANPLLFHSDEEQKPGNFK